MGINGILKIMGGIRSEKDFIRVCQTFAKNGKRVQSTRLPLQGEDLKILPEALQQMTKGLKKPVVTVGYNSSKGQSILGMRINDGNKPVSAVAISFDTTRGAKPILQAKYRMMTPDTGETAMSGSKMFNLNSTSDDFIHAFSKRNGVLRLEHLENGAYSSQTFNPVAASKHNLEMPTAEEFAGIENTIGKQLKRMKGEFEGLIKPQKVKKPKAVNTPARPQRPSFAAEAKEIMAFEGATSVESANKAKDLLMKRMGYDPKLITIKGKDLTNDKGQAYFNPISGEIIVNESMAGKATHFDVADVLLHELTHMDDHVKLCKYMGIDKYEKLMLELKKSAKAEDAVFNRAFYEEAIKQANITGFNAKPILKEIKDTIRLNSSNFTDEYAQIIDRYTYATSPMEINARRAERTLIKELKAGGVQITHSMPLKEYGKTPSSHLIEIMPKIESKLGKYPLAQRNDVFNKAHDAALAELEPEFATLLKKLKTEGLTVGSPEQIRFKELNKTLGGKDFDMKLLNRMLELI